MTTSPLQRKLIARQGAYAQQAKHDVKAITAKARQVFRESFAVAVRERWPELEEEEVQRRAQAARKAWYNRLSLRSAQVRARRVAARKAAKAKRRAAVKAARSMSLLPAKPESLSDPPSAVDSDESGSELPETPDGR